MSTLGLRDLPRTATLPEIALRTKRVQATAYSLRSCVAPASSRA
jgi:hypothetical protein